MIRKAIIIVSGKVQGVYYRVWAKEQANELGLTGYARNEPDGTVCIVVEGDEKKINDFIERCRTGSDSAEVIDLQVEWSGASRNFADFSIQ